MVLRHTDNLSKSLQGKSLSAAEGQKMAAMVTGTLQSIRSSESFQGSWKLATDTAEQLELSPPLTPRRRKRPSLLEQGQVDPEFPPGPSPEDHYISKYILKHWI
jgi:hypothetical protein